MALKSVHCGSVSIGHVICQHLCRNESFRVIWVIWVICHLRFSVTCINVRGVFQGNHVLVTIFFNSTFLSIVSYSLRLILDVDYEYVFRFQFRAWEICQRQNSTFYRCVARHSDEKWHFIAPSLVKLYMDKYDILTQITYFWNVVDIYQW